MRSTLTLAALALAAAPALAGPIVIDGDLADWPADPPTQTDPAGDNAGPFDITRVWLGSDEDRVLLRFNTGTDQFNLQAGAYGLGGALRFELTFNDPAGTRLWLDTLQHVAQINDGGGYEDVRWGDLGAVLLPTYASAEYEFSVPRSIAPGATEVSVEFLVSDTLTAGPVALESVQAPAPLSHERPAGTDLRVASLNTLNTGTADFSRRSAILRLMRAVRADVYALQEEYDTSAADVEAFLEEADPFGDGAEWNAEKLGDTLVASRFPIIQTPPSQRFTVQDASAFVDLSSVGGGLVFLASIHPSCCGYAGNSNDNSRVSQMSSIASVIGAIRAGAADALVPGASDAAVIVAGDWNLVGSRTPLTILEESAGLVAPPFADLGTGASASTWRPGNDFVGQFFFGRLDLIAHDPARLASLGGYVLDTRTLTPARLGELGLSPGDSAASDHLVVVADYAVVNQPADLDGDGDVDSADLGALLAAWGTPGADLTGDGVTNSADLGALLASWG